MTGAESVLSALHAAGFVVSVHGLAVRCVGPGAVPGDLRARVIQHKPELLELLRARARRPHALVSVQLALGSRPVARPAPSPSCGHAELARALDRHELDHVRHALGAGTRTPEQLRALVAARASGSLRILTAASLGLGGPVSSARATDDELRVALLV